MSPGVRAKCCGITRSKDMVAALTVGFNAIGLIFFQQSIRFVSPAQGRKIISRTSAPNVVVGVFVAIDLQQFYGVHHSTSFSMAQFHNHTSLLRCLEFSSVIRVPWQWVLSIKHFASFSITNNVSNKMKFSSYFKGMLLDTYSKQYGGSGRPFKWHDARPLSNCRLIISGGIVPKNVAEIMLLGFGAVDVSSGVETKSKCSKKSTTRMKNLVSIIYGK